MIREKLVVLEANVDDMNPQDLPPALEALFAAGALDAWITPIQMKKGRTGCTVAALVKEEFVSTAAEAMLLHTTTIGVRAYDVIRYSVDRTFENVQTEWGPCAVKSAALPDGTTRRVPEFEDLKRLADASGLPVIEVRARVLRLL